MTEEQQIEEILWEAHSYGIREEVMSEAVTIQIMNPKMSRVRAYEETFQKLLKQKNKV